jgi:hypothetical protein
MHSISSIVENEQCGILETRPLKIANSIAETFGHIHPQKPYLSLTIMYRGNKKAAVFGCLFFR